MAARVSGSTATRWWGPNPMTNIASFERPPDLVEIFNKAVMERDQEKQKAGTGEIVAKMNEQALMIPVYHHPPRSSSLPTCIPCTPRPVLCVGIGRTSGWTRSSSSADAVRSPLCGAAVDMVPPQAVAWGGMWPGAVAGYRISGVE